MDSEPMPARMPVTAAILCGGHARRMGGADKGQLLVSGATIIERQLAVLRPLATDIMLIDRDRRHTAPAAARVVGDLVPDSGALGGIYTALESSMTDHVVVVACDMPFLTTAFIAAMIEEAETADVVIPRDGRGRHALCGVFHRRIAPTLRARIDQGRLRIDEALAGLVVHEINAELLATLDRDGRLLVNVNTPEDYRDLPGGYDTP